MADAVDEMPLELGIHSCLNAEEELTATLIGMELPKNRLIRPITPYHHSPYSGVKSVLFIRHRVKKFILCHIYVPNH